MFPRRPLSTWQVQPALSRRVLAGIFAPGGTVCGAKATIIAAEVPVAAVAVEDHAAPGDSFSGHLCFSPLFVTFQSFKRPGIDLHRKDYRKTVVFQFPATACRSTDKTFQASGMVLHPHVSPPTSSGTSCT